ncbi:MAG: ABC transporter permease [Lachnospiraceae bacterium]|nr:ABC transporter permease [Lachnospiraceae bacterium]
MTKIDLKRVGKYTFLIFAVAAVLFTVGAWERIMEATVFGIRFLWIYPFLLLLLAAALFLWLKRLVRCQAEGRSAAGLYFLQTMHRYRFLIEQLVERDFKVKYKRSVLGAFWSFLNPLLMMIVQYVVFSHLLGIRGNVEHYAIYLLCGIVMWNGFNDCSTQSMRSITSNAALITKVYVPKYIYPVTKVLSASINILLSMIPLLLVTTVYGLFSTPHLYLSKAVCLLPFGLLLLLIFCVGMGFFLSSLMVFFHDIEFLWGFVSTLWMYATPIIYSLSMFEEKAAWLVKLMQFNPLYHYIQFIRTIILERTSPAFSEYGICLLCSVGIFLLGFFMFRKVQDKFILYL